MAKEYLGFRQACLLSFMSYSLFQTVLMNLRLADEGATFDGDLEAGENIPGKID